MRKEEFLKQAIGDVLPQYVNRHVYKTTFNMPKAEQFLLKNQHVVNDYSTAFSLANKMHSNNFRDFGGEIPKSAFYTFFRAQGLLVVETGEGLLHDYLRANIDYNQRIQIFDAEVRSGHFCENIEFSPTEVFSVALFDSLTSSGIVVPKNPEHLMAVTLAQNGILPLTEDCYVPYVMFGK